MAPKTQNEILPGYDYREPIDLRQSQPVGGFSVGSSGSFRPNAINGIDDALIIADELNKLNVGNG